MIAGVHMFLITYGHCCRCHGDVEAMRLEYGEVEVLEEHANCCVNHVNRVQLLVYQDYAPHSPDFTFSMS